MEEEQKRKVKEDIDGSSLAIGLSLGTAFGIIFDNLALWLPLGVAMAFALGVMKKRKNKDNNSNNNDTNKQ